MAENNIAGKGEDSLKESELDELESQDFWSDDDCEACDESEKQSSRPSETEKKPGAEASGLDGFLASIVDEYKEKVSAKAEKQAEPTGIGIAKTSEIAESEEKASSKAGRTAESEAGTIKAEKPGEAAGKETSAMKGLVNALGSTFSAMTAPFLGRSLTKPAQEKNYENLQLSNGVVEEVTTPQGTFRLVGNDEKGESRYLKIEPGADDEGNEFKGSVKIKDGQLIIHNSETGKTEEFKAKPVKYDSLLMSNDGQKVEQLDTNEKSYRYIGPGSDGKDQYLVTTPEDQEGQLLNGSVSVKNGKVTVSDNDSGLKHEYRKTDPLKASTQDSLYESTRQITVNATRAIAGESAAKNVDDAFKDPSKLQQWYKQAQENAAKIQENAAKAQAKDAGSDSAPKAEAKGPGKGAESAGQAKPGAPGEKAGEAKPGPGPGDKAAEAKTQAEKQASEQKQQADAKIIADQKLLAQQEQSKTAATNELAQTSPENKSVFPLAGDTKTSPADQSALNKQLLPNSQTLMPDNKSLLVSETKNAQEVKSTEIPPSLLNPNQTLLNAPANNLINPDMLKTPLPADAKIPVQINDLVQRFQMPVENKEAADAVIPHSAPKENALIYPGEKSEFNTIAKTADAKDISSQHLEQAKPGQESTKFSSPTVNLAQNQIVFAKAVEQTKAQETGSSQHGHSEFKQASSLQSSVLERNSQNALSSGAQSLKSFDAQPIQAQAKDLSVSKDIRVDGGQKIQAESVSKFLPQIQGSTITGGSRDQSLNISSANRSIELQAGQIQNQIQNQQAKADATVLQGKVELRSLDPQTGKLINSDAQATTKTSSLHTAGQSSVLNSTIHNTNAAKVQADSLNIKAQQAGLRADQAGLRPEQAGMMPNAQGIRPFADLTSIANVTAQGRLDGLTGRVRIVDGTQIGDTANGAISISGASKIKGPEGRYMIAEMTLAVVLAAGGIRRVLPTDRGKDGKSNSGGGSGLSDRKSIERELSRLREPARADSLKFVDSSYKLSRPNLKSESGLAAGLRSSLETTQLANGRQLLLAADARVHFRSFAVQKQAETYMSQEARTQTTQLALGYAQTELRPLLADAGSGRNFAMPAESSVLEQMFKAQQKALDEVLRPLLNPEDYLEVDDPFESFKNVFAAKASAKGRQRKGSSVGLEKQSLLKTGSDGGDDFDDEEDENKNLILMRPSWLISPGETLISIAEEHFSDPYIGWLIADLNKDKSQEHYMDGKRIVEFKSRQKLTLPVWQDIVDFYGSMPRNARPENLVTIVSATQIDREVVNSVLGPILDRKRQQNSIQSSADSAKGISADGNEAVLF